jgi:hypothetical protein
MTAIAPTRTHPTERLGTGSTSRRAPEDEQLRQAAPTPLFTRHMLGAIEVERDQRRERRGRSGAAGAGRRRPAARALHPRLTAASAGFTAGSGVSVRIQRPDLDRWRDDGGSMIADLLPRTDGHHNPRSPSDMQSVI